MLQTNRGRHIMVQPLLLAAPLAISQGFLARFPKTGPPCAIGPRLRRGHKSASDPTVHAFAVKPRSILAQPMPTGANPQEPQRPRLTLSARAREGLWRHPAAVEAAQAQCGPLDHVWALASKAVEQAARIATVLTLWADLEAPEGTAQGMTSGVTLADFDLDEAKRLAEAGAVTGPTERAEALRRWLMESWEGDAIPPRCGQKGAEPDTGNAAEREALAVLERNGWLMAQRPETQRQGRRRPDGAPLP